MMNWLRRLVRHRPILRDAEFGRLEYDGGTWTSSPTSDRGYIVVVVADERGPTAEHRQLFHKILDSLTDVVAEAEGFLRQHPEVEETIGPLRLRLYSIVLSGDCETGTEEFAIELTNAGPPGSDTVCGVQFVNHVPATWYIDH